MEPKRARPGRAGSVPGHGGRARHWLPAFTAISLAAMAISGAAGTAADAASTPQDTMQVWPAAVPASSTQTFDFTYTAAERTSQFQSVTLDVPPGWTNPFQATPAQAHEPGAVTLNCTDCLTKKVQLSVINRQIRLTTVLLPKGGTLTITYAQAKVPAAAGTTTFDAAAGVPPGSLDNSPAVSVTCADGTGMVSVSPDQARTASTSKLTFVYTPAGGCDLADGAVSLVVPAGWTRPSATPGTAGYVSSDLGPSSVEISGATMTVSGVTLAAGQPFIIIYHQATAPAAATTSAFVASEKSAAAGSLTSMLISPKVAVRPGPTPASPRTAAPVSPPSTTTATHTPPGSSSAASSGPASTPTRTVTPTPRLNSAGIMTVSPSTVTAGHPSPLTFTYRAPAGGLPPAGEVTLTVPPGWTAPSATPGAPGYVSATPGTTVVSGRRIKVTGVTLAPGEPLIISYRPQAVPRAAGSSVFDASERPSTTAVLTALTDSPSVAIAGPAPFHIPATVGFILLAAACAAALATIRFLRRHRGPPSPPAPTLSTVPHAGPPSSVTVEPSRTETTHTMRIEPHPASAVTTIEEPRS